MRWPWTKQDTPPPPAEATAEVASCASLDITKLHADLSLEYVRSIYLWRAVDMIGSMAASVPLKIVLLDEEDDDNGNGGNGNGKSRKLAPYPSNGAPEDGIEELLRRPNPHWNGYALQYYVAVSLAVANRAYLLRIRGAGGITQELWPLATNDVTPTYDTQTGWLTGWQVMWRNQLRNYPVDENGESDIIWIRRPCLNRQTDKSPATIAAAPAEVFTRVLQRCADIVSNSSNITGVLSTETELAKGAVEEIKRRIEQFKTGKLESGSTLVTANAKWNMVRLSEDPAQALSVEVKDSLARDVVMTFGVPTQLVGLPGSDTYNNLAQARVGFLTETILPAYIGLYVHGLNHALMKNGTRIVPDVENVPSMIAFRRELIEMAGKASMLSINEQRALLGYPKFEEDDDSLAADSDEDADVPVKLLELRLKRLAVEAQAGGVSNLLGGAST